MQIALIEAINLILLPHEINFLVWQFSCKFNQPIPEYVFLFLFIETNDLSLLPINLASFRLLFLNMLLFSFCIYSSGENIEKQ